VTHEREEVVQHSSVVATIPSGTISDDLALVQAARENGEAFGILYERYLTRIYAYLRARTATNDDADDLTQQVFLQALQALPQYREQRGTLVVWLFGIARNAATDFYRRRRHTIAWHDIPEAAQPSEDSDLDAKLIYREELGHLHRLLGGLKPEAREVLALRFAARLSVAEVAAVVGKSEAAIKKQLTRTVRTLKEQYHDDTR